MYVHNADNIATGGSHLTKKFIKDNFCAIYIAIAMQLKFERG